MKELLCLLLLGLIVSIFKDNGICYMVSLLRDTVFGLWNDKWILDHEQLTLITRKIIRKMIISRKELKEFILYDRKAQGAMLHPFLSSITYSEQYLIRKYLTILRHYEFHINMCHSKKMGEAVRKLN